MKFLGRNQFYYEIVPKRQRSTECDWDMEDTMRLNKYIAHAGICSRRKADELIANGNVKINGLAVKEMGADVAEGDVVEVNGRIIGGGQKAVYVAVNKPL